MYIIKKKIAILRKKNKKQVTSSDARSLSLAINASTVLFIICSWQYGRSIKERFYMLHPTRYAVIILATTCSFYIDCWVSSSKTVRLRTPCGARCVGYAVRTWYAVCSEAAHSQFDKGARPHLCMDEWNRPTSVRRRLSLTQAARGKLIPTGLSTGPGHKNTTPGSIFTILRLPFVICPFRSADANCGKVDQKRFCAPGTNGRLNLSLTWRVSEIPLIKII